MPGALARERGGSSPVPGKAQGQDGTSGCGLNFAGGKLCAGGDYGGAGVARRKLSRAGAEAAGYSGQEEF